MKKAFQILILLLAVNFIALAAGVGWLIRSGHLDRQRAMQIKELVFPPPPAPDAVNLQTRDEPATQPATSLETLLARSSGQSATEQVELIQQAFDAQMAQLDRRQRELTDLQQQVELARTQLSRDRAAVVAKQQQLADQEALAGKLQKDKGFQDSLALYAAMPSRQVKDIFMSLDDQTVINYLQAMEPRIASKILREFKSTQEISRVETILEKMRQAQASAQD